MLDLFRQSWAALRLLVVATVTLGIVYPLAVYGVGRLDARAADGSMLSAGGREVGSSLIGQSFDGDQWFQPRPSNAGDGYDPLASGASNLGPENEDLVKAIADRRAEVAKANGVPADAVPVDAVTSSASGLDPDISPAYAALQVARVAKARGLSTTAVAQLVKDQEKGRLLGFIGEPRVNVLELNAALQQLAP